jgi:glycosyltransferase involved in cell wall biosynthesis
MIEANVLHREPVAAHATSAIAARRRVCVITEDLLGAPDEGIKKFAFTVAQSLRSVHDVTLLGTRGETSLPNARVVPAPRTFLSPALARELRQQRPDVVIYVATASTTLWSFARSRVLKLLAPSARIVLVGLWAHRHRPWQQRLIRFVAPDLVCVQSPATQRYLADLGCRVSVVPSGVDLDRFRPVPDDRQRQLRDQYGVRHDLPVVLHVGHLQQRRGVGILAEIAASGDCQAVLVTSSSTPRDLAVARSLRKAGVLVITTYQPHIEELYQLADCYLFPVASRANSIEAPLSVLEAFACDMPVVSTRFGGLESMFGQSRRDGLVFADDPADLVSAARRLARERPTGTRSLVLPYSWDAIATQLLDLAIGGVR